MPSIVGITKIKPTLLDLILVMPVTLKITLYFLIYQISKL
jgi:hypothetical protein